MSLPASTLPDLRAQVHDAAKRARVAARTLATLNTALPPDVVLANERGPITAIAPT